MIRKNDCVPKKVLNQRKLRRQAIAVMIGGLVVAFLLGLIIGWFIPKKDKGNVTASAETVATPFGEDLTRYFREVQGSIYAPLFSFSLTSFSSVGTFGGTGNVTYTFFYAFQEGPLGGAPTVLGPNMGVQVSGYVSRSAQVNVVDFFVRYDSTIGNSGTVISGTAPSFVPIPSWVIPTSSGNVTSFSSAEGVIQTYFQNVSGYFLFMPSFSPSASPTDLPHFALTGVPDAYRYIVHTNPSPLFFQASAGQSRQNTPILVRLGFDTSNPNLIYTQGQYDSYGNNRYNAGKNEGYSSGYAAGVAAGGNNNFMSLITAVVDAPIKAFTSLLDFDILGYNMKNLALALLTAGLLVAAIRFFSRL